MSMQTHEILCRHTGEYSYTTKDPVAVWTGQVDLTEQQDCILSSSDWRPMTTNRWEVRKVTLPAWMSAEEWVRDWITWKYVWGMGALQDWPEAWQRGIARLQGEAHRFAAIQLLKVKNFRSEYRASLRRQLEDWCAGKGQYDSPFSRRQWDTLLPARVCREARRVGEALYRSR